MAGPSLKLNTADFQLLLGGYYLLEDGSGRYLLEDSSGAYLLDAYVPQVGDPVVFTQPTWSGRVVSVNRRDIMTARTNYDEVSITATNTAVAGSGSGALLSDGGSYYLLEDSSGRYQLEDASGLYLLDAAAYRNLAVRVSQNQDGSTTTYGSLETYTAGYAAGQTFLLVSSNLNLSSSYTITNVTTDFEGANPPTPYYTIEFGDAYQTLQQAGGGILTRQASAPTQALGVVMPGGVLGYAEVTADQGTFTALTDITGLTVTVTVASGRRIRISAKVACSSSVAGDSADLQILEGATMLENAEAVVQTTAITLVSIAVEVILTPTASIHTYKVSMRRVAGTGNLTMRAVTGGFSGPAWLLVEDIGT